MRLSGVDAQDFLVQKVCDVVGSVDLARWTMLGGESCAQLLLGFVALESEVNESPY